MTLIQDYIIAHGNPIHVRVDDAIMMFVGNFGYVVVSIVGAVLA